MSFGIAPYIRELISVFVGDFQALDKIRFLALTDKDVLGEGDTAKLEIQVSYLFLNMIYTLNLSVLKIEFHIFVFIQS